MINLQSIISLFDDKPTLLKWLKKVEAALAASVLTSVTISQPSETTAVLTFNFEDGTNIETPAITLPRGASVVNAMLDANNNLILVLDDGRQINVGNIMPQNINAQNGTFSVSLTTPRATISVGNIGNLSVTTHLEAESIDTAGTIYSEGGIIAEETIHTDENLEVGGNAAVTGSVTAASFIGENARPIYQHNIELYSTTAQDLPNTHAVYLTFAIYNSSPTPITTIEQILQEIRSISERYVLRVHGTLYINNLLLDMRTIMKRNNVNTINLVYYRNNEWSVMNSVDLSFITPENGYAITDTLLRLNG